MIRFILSAAVAAILAGNVSASDCYMVKKVVTYKTVVCYVDKEVGRTICVTEYDDCGRPVTKERTIYKTIQVPVEKTVPVVKYVKVPAY